MSLLCQTVVMYFIDTQPCSSAIAFPVVSSNSLQLVTESSIHNAIRASLWKVQVGNSNVSFIFHSVPVACMELGPALSKLDGSSLLKGQSCWYSLIWKLGAVNVALQLHPFIVFFIVIGIDWGCSAKGTFCKVVMNYGRHERNASHGIHGVPF